jgi:hypothetical protein
MDEIIEASDPRSELNRMFANIDQSLIEIDQHKNKPRPRPKLKLIEGGKKDG